MPELQKLTLETIAAGVAPELFERELAKVLENIKDPNTAAAKKRQIRLTFTFVPREDRNGARNEMAVVVDSESKLVPVLGAGSFAFLGRENGELAAWTNDVKQEEMELVNQETGEVTNIRDRKPKAGA